MAQLLNLEVKAHWTEIDYARDEAIRFMGGRGFTEEAVDAVAMIVCELTENANKYGRFRNTEATIGISIWIEEGAIIVQVCNPIDGEQREHLLRLDTMVQWIRGYQDPFEAYLEKVKEVSVQNLHSEESGLGLVRIAYEGQSILDFCVNDENILAVSAVYQL